MISFLVLLFGLAYPAMSLPVLAAHGVIPDGWMPRPTGLDTERIAAAMLVFLALLSTTFVVTWSVDGRPGVLRLVRRMFSWRIGARWSGCLRGVVRSFGDHLFTQLCIIDCERDDHGRPVTYTAYERFPNPQRVALHRYGQGPFVDLDDLRR